MTNVSIYNAKRDRSIEHKEGIFILDSGDTIRVKDIQNKKQLTIGVNSCIIDKDEFDKLVRRTFIVHVEDTVEDDTVDIDAVKAENDIRDRKEAEEIAGLIATINQYGDKRAKKLAKMGADLYEDLTKNKIN